jgi:microcystin-dependent protein
MDMFLGTIIAVGFSFPPRGWMACNGQLLPVNQYAALFALLGTQYGGDGANTFGLPDLRGRLPLGNSQGLAGRIAVTNGATGGAASYTGSPAGTGTITNSLTLANLPAHTHNATFTASGGSGSTIAIKVSTDVGTSPSPSPTSYLAAGKSSAAAIPYPYRPDIGNGSTTLAADMATISGGGSGGTVAVDSTGTGAPLNIPVTVTTTLNIPTVTPYQGVLYIICVEGIFPSRN